MTQKVLTESGLRYIVRSRLRASLALHEARKISDKNMGGDCYEAAAKYMMSHPNDGLMLVHAEVMGQGHIEGITFGHAFIIDNDNVIEVANGQHFTLPKIVYYALGQIDDIGNEWQYTYREMLEKITQYHHWGPWDLETTSGL